MTEHTAEPLSEMVIRFVPLDLVVQWRRCGMIADFLANFLAYSFEEKETAGNVISTVLNELLENAVKFSPEKTRRANLSLAHYGDTVQIKTTNTSDANNVGSLTDLVERLRTEEAEILFIEQLEYTAESGDGSGLGMITMKKDYGARIAVDLVPPPDLGPDSGLVDVTVTLELDVAEVEQR